MIMDQESSKSFLTGNGKAKYKFYLEVSFSNNDLLFLRRFCCSFIFACQR